MFLEIGQHFCKRIFHSDKICSQPSGSFAALIVTGAATFITAIALKRIYTKGFVRHEPFHSHKPSLFPKFKIVQERYDWVDQKSKEELAATLKDGLPIFKWAIFQGASLLMLKLVRKGFQLQNKDDLLNEYLDYLMQKIQNEKLTTSQRESKINALHLVKEPTTELEQFREFQKNPDVDEESDAYRQHDHLCEIVELVEILSDVQVSNPFLNFLEPQTENKEDIQRLQVALQLLKNPTEEYKNFLLLYQADRFIADFEGNLLTLEFCQEKAADHEFSFPGTPTIVKD